MKVGAAFAVALLLSALSALAQDLRFSATLGAADRTAAGLGRLSSDQVAVLDALVRRDTAAHGAGAAAEKSDAPFTQRLTAGERRTAGLGALSAAELAQLDGFVERHQAAKLARTLLAPPAYLTPRSRVAPTERKTEREIHGSFSLSYGFGSGGYSEKAGSMVLTMEDPARHYAISVGYAESHVKGGSYLYRDPFYDRPRVIPADDPPHP